MKSEFTESPDSTLIDGLAFFGKHGKSMIITRVREHKARKNSMQNMRFQLIMYPLYQHDTIKGGGSVFSFHRDEMKIIEINRCKVVFHFEYARRGRKILTIFLNTPESMTLMF